MRIWGALITGLLICLQSGCLGQEHVPTTSWLDRFHGMDLANVDHLIRMEIRVVERSIGDSYLNREVWRATNEQIIPWEHKFLLEQNGFRVGQIVGMVPSELQRMMTSERTCINPRLRVVANGGDATIYLGPLQPRIQFRLEKNGSHEDVELEQSQCCLDLTLTMAEDGRTKVRFLPCIEHGGNIQQLRAAEDQSNWILEVGPKKCSYPALAWEIELENNKWLLIGTSLSKPGTLGHESFVGRYMHGPVQRLLAIRISRPDAGIDAEIGDIDMSLPGESDNIAPSLAAQITARGSRH